MVLEDYHNIQACLSNTTALEGLNLVLFAINETTLVKWYKEDIRRDKIRMLMQGLPPPQHQQVAQDDLPPAKELPSLPAPLPVIPHVLEEAEDTSGQAMIRKSSFHPPAGSGSSGPIAPDPTADPTLDPTLSTTDPTADPTLDPILSTPGPSAPKSRTTEWRHKKEREEGKQTKTKI